jgi:SAM-dependent methyltransferase
MPSAITGNVNSEFFNGKYKEIWRSFIPEALTKAETEFLMQVASLAKESKVLDLMCGYGRNTIGLAEKGIQVTAVDNLADYINEIEQQAGEKSLPVLAVCTDVLNFDPGGQYDLVICMGNSLSFFNREESLLLFSKIAGVLPAGGKLVFSTWTIAEIAIKQFQERSWNYVGDLKFLYEGKFLFNPSRIEFESIFISPDGETETKKGIDYIYSVAEIDRMLSDSGMTIKEIWSIPGKKKFTVGEPRAYFVVEKL